MSNNNRQNILWTATDIPLPKELWDRLEGLGYKVLVAEHSDNPLERIEKAAPKLWIAQMNGRADQELAAIGDIRSRCPDLPIILMTRRPDIDEAVKAIKMGVHDYVPGGASVERVWATIEGALTRTGAAVRPQLHDGDHGDAASQTPIAVDPGMKGILALAKKIARSRTTVLIQGESGTGKEVIARFIHRQSDHRDGPFVAVNCAALPETLLESELFGHEKGAFTGAVSRKKGKFELAHGGTLLLDEISETEVSIQAKLLRVLQEREIDRVGGQSAVPVDTRVIATTNRDLEAETKAGNFRLDLFYRLNVVPFRLPPLRERVDDIVPLAGHFLETHCSLNRIPVKKMAPEVEAALRQRPWPGNVRELENLMERASLLVDSDLITSRDLDMIDGPGDGHKAGVMSSHEILPLKDMEKKMIFRALDDHRGNRTHAARVLGISVRTLRNKLHEYLDETEAEELIATEA